MKGAGGCRFEGKGSPAGHRVRERQGPGSSLEFGVDEKKNRFVWGILNLRGLEGTGGAAQGWVEYMGLGFRSEDWDGDGIQALSSLKQSLRLEEAGGAHAGRLSERVLGGEPAEGVRWCI